MKNNLFNPKLLAVGAALAIVGNAGAAIVFADLSFEDATSTALGGTGAFTLGDEARAFGEWAFGNGGRINFLTTPTIAGTTGSTYAWTDNRAGGLVQYAYDGKATQNATVTFTLDYRYANTATANGTFAIIAFAFNSTDTVTVDAGESAGTYFDATTDAFKGIGPGTMFDAVPPLSSVSTYLIDTDMTSFQTATVDLDLGATGYDYVGFFIVSDGSSGFAFDNVTVSVPEPHAALLGSLGLLALLRRRR